MKARFFYTVLMIAALAALGGVSFARAGASRTGAASGGDSATNDIPNDNASGLKQSTAPAPPPADSSSTDDDHSLKPPPEDTSPPAAVAGDLSKPIDEAMKVQIIRFIDGEFGKAAKPIPGKTNGFTIEVGKPINDQSYSDALRLQGTAIGAGDPVQVTRVDFEARKIVLQLNGGAKKKFHLMDHIQIGMGGDPDPGGVTPPQDSSGRRGEGIGAVIVLDYGKPLPDVSPDDIKEELSPLIDFTKQRSAAVNWVDTLPTEYQDAIRDHKALPGMDQETVIAAIGRPDKKVREKNADGIETEDWIYGNPPARTTFVTFIGDKVAKVEVYN